jgi:hypothetical protein
VIVSAMLATSTACNDGERAASPETPTSPAPPAVPTTGPLEITAHDITSVGELGSRQLTVIGVPMGATRAEAERIVGADPRFRIEPDTGNPERFYVKDAASGKALFYFIWDASGPSLDRVTVFVDARTLMVGRAQDLLSLGTVDPESEVRREFLGEPASDAVTLDIPSIGLRHVTYYFPRHGLEVTDKNSGDGRREAVFALVRSGPGAPAKP